ncbi:putative phosphohistidine phosphatase, SixA [Methylophaga frappieri]|uniref:Putative phosphohistidine phosphatase, SixA n=1 Tax=Methylophaga frappieri (strain ATCC BAA-2434 / DSM 25690 / JAM7) TaxID=754477 RepID=I1YIJ9_METFJ|nr:histidine phosphatase family protein [Methylophaga frappieri]AFJ02742.1 putative phosphohistidine phosphatase, SixA [Methylophaga frappieri]
MATPSSRKTLLLMRHGKASNNSHYADIDRPLTRMGEDQCRQIADWLGSHVGKPDYWLVSPALRTQQTADIVSHRLRCHPRASVSPISLYLAEPTSLIGSLRQLPDTVQTVILVGHNPGLSESLRLLTGGTMLESLLQPASLAVMTLDDAWSRLGSSPLRLYQVKHAS